MKTYEKDVCPKDRLYYRACTAASANGEAFVFLNIETERGEPRHMILNAKSAMQLSRALQMAIFQGALMASGADDNMLAKAAKIIGECK